MLTTRTSWIYPFVIWLSVVGSTDAELAVVTADRVDLYKGAKVAAYLVRDEIVHVRENVADPDWFHIYLDNASYQARRGDFQTQGSLFSEFRKEQVGLETELDRVNEQLNANFERILQLFASILQVQWDRAVFVQTADPLVIEPRTIAQPKTSGREAVVARDLIGERLVIPRFKRFEKISQLKANQVGKKWRDQLQDVEQSNRALIRRRTELNERVAGVTARFRQRSKHFDRFASSSATYLEQPFVLTRSSATVYENRERIHEIRRGQAVIGKFNREHPDRLLVAYLNRWYDTPASGFRSRQDVEIEHAAVAARYETMINNLEGQVNLLRRQEKIITSYILDMTRAGSIKGEFVSFLRETSPDDVRLANEYYWLHRPAGSEEVLYRGRVARTVNDWQDQADDLQKEIDRVWERLGKAKEEMVDQETTYRDLIQRFDAIGDI